MVGGTQATETRVKNTAGERSGCKTKHCAGGGGGGGGGGGSVSQSKSGPEPPICPS